MNRLCLFFPMLVLLTGAPPLAAPGDAAPGFCTRTGTLQLKNHIMLSGTPFLELHYGPPNYGEYPKTDEKMNQVFFKLDDPLRVIRKDRPDPAPDVVSTITVKDIQLIPVSIPHSIRSQYPPVGKHVVIEGALFGADTGYHNRPVLMELSSFRAGGRIACDGSEVR